MATKTAQNAEKAQWQVKSLADQKRTKDLKKQIPKDLYLFISCTGSVEYPGTERCVRYVGEKLGYTMTSCPDQTCCTGYMLTCDALNPALALCSAGRNLSIPESMGKSVVAFCNGCFGYLNELNHLIQHGKGIKDMVNQGLATIGRHYDDAGRVYHAQEIWYSNLAELKKMVVRPLTGLRVAAHYGCHYVAQKKLAVDDHGYPTFHEEIYSALGATPVSYNEKRACCGYSVGRGFTHREETVLPHLAKKFQSAVDEGVELMTSVCPGCNVALDRTQPDLRKLGVPTSIPVIDLSQLIAFAIGAPLEILGFEMNTTPVMPVLERFLK